MKTQLNKVKSYIAGAGIFVVGCVLASLGLGLVFFLATFALAVIGLGLLASPFVSLAQPSAQPETKTQTI